MIRTLGRAQILGLAIVALAAAELGARQATPMAAARDTGLADATSAMRAGAFDRATALANAYLRRHPADSAAHVVLARVGIAQDNLDAAYVELRRAIDANPRNVDALYYLGLVAGRLAQTSFEDLQRSAPDSPRVHQLLAEGLEAQDKRDAAAKEYEAALERQPDLLEALLGLARLRRIQLACDAAVPLYERAEKVRATFDGAYGLAMCQSLLQDDEAACANFERAIAREPNSPIAWMGLGESLAKLRRFPEATAKLQHAIALEPKLGEAYYALGMIYQSTSQPALAQQAFKKAEELGGAIGVSRDPAQPPEQRPK